MLNEYLPILILFIINIAFAVGIIIFSHFLGPRKSSAEKLSPYESGVPPVGDTRIRFSVKFYLIAMLFIVFDIEVVFMYPWAVIFKKLGLFGFVEMFVFIGILLIGYVYVWKKGALKWE
ncbi:MAG: NADH-quinone oxidoreductase subunit A [Deltaproteobacteria bacterium]|nr:MAG: NADH-quinone oxidoreductase subunit A [Deltaproteobacteria bacterium]